MCLLKPGHPDADCHHEECKNFYMLVKHTHSSHKPNSPKLQFLSEKSQIEPSSTSPTSILMPKESPSLNAKRAHAGTSEMSTDGESDPTKKVKLEEKENGYQNSAQSPDNVQNSYNVFMGFQPSSMENQNPGQQFRVFSVPNGPTILVPVVQGISPESINNILTTKDQSQFERLQFHPQIIYKNPEIGENNGQDSKGEGVPGNNNEGGMSDFESQTLNFLLNQNKMLTYLDEKNDLIQETLVCLINEISSIKSQISHLITHDKTPAPAPAISLALNQQVKSGSNDSIASEDLLKYLCKENGGFEHKFVLGSDLSFPLYRDRNFGFKIHLVDNDGKLVANSNKIPVAIGIYTCENPPKYIDSNTAGNRIFKGIIEKDLVKGVVTFDKIQVKEVSSHFRNGWVFFVVQHKPHNNYSSNVFEQNENVVDPKKIRPLIFEKVIIKAKKIKDKNSVFEQKDGLDS